MPYDSMNRRYFLRAAGLALIGLPFFPSLRLDAAEGAVPPPQEGAEPRRLVLLCTPLGFLPNHWVIELGSRANESALAKNVKDGEGWFPNDDGPGYTMPHTHTDLVPFREHISFLKGMCQPRYRGNPHRGDDVFLTGADTFANPAQGFTNTISCDQVAAASAVFAPPGVRHPCLALGADTCGFGSNGALSWTDQGVPILPTRSPAELFDTLFGVEKLPLEVRLERLKSKKSILDLTLEELGNLSRSLNPADRRKLDEAVSAVRDSEAGIQTEQRWLTVPKPKTTVPRPEDSLGTRSITAHCSAMFDLVHAAFLTDSTRVVTYEMPSNASDVCNKAGKHELNHGNADPVLHQGHLDLDRHMSKQVAYLLKRLDGSLGSDGKSLLHHTCGAYGSGVWGPTHGLHSLPLLCFGHAGGALKQGATLLDPKGATPMSNLWLTLLQASGVAVDRFSDSSGTIRELLS